MNPRWPSALRCLTLLLLPAGFVIAALSLSRDRGPVWLGSNSDPSYQYLLNALLILEGQTPAHTDHPGTPVQVIGAAILRLTTPGPDAAARSLAVLAEPEAALARIHAGSLGLTAAALALAGLLVLRHRGSWPQAVAVQLVPLIQAGTYRSTLGFDPEAFLMPLTVLFVTTFAIRSAAPEPGAGEGPADLNDIALGLLAGVGLAMKVTFAPLCLLPFVVQRTRRANLLTAAAMMTGAAAALAPVLGELPRILQWLGNLATHTGTYGSGAAGFIDRQKYPHDVLTLFGADRVLLVLVPASLVTGAVLLAAGKSEPRTCRVARRLVGLAATQTLAVLLIAKHPHARYLVPVALSCTLNAVLLLELGAAWRGRTAGRRGAALMLVTAAAAMFLVVLDVHRQAEALRSARVAQLAHNRRADLAAADGIRVDYYRSSSPAFALYFGNNSAGRYFAEPLARLHPGKVFFNPWAGLYEHFAGPADPKPLFQSRPVYLVGNGEIERLPAGARLPRPAGWNLTRIESVDGYTIHRLQPPP